jgi:hypothetical protein
MAINSAKSACCLSNDFLIIILAVYFVSNLRMHTFKGNRVWCDHACASDFSNTVGWFDPSIRERSMPDTFKATSSHERTCAS